MVLSDHATRFTLFASQKSMPKRGKGNPVATGSTAGAAGDTSTSAGVQATSGRTERNEALSFCDGILRSNPVQLLNETAIKTAIHHSYQAMKLPSELDRNLVLLRLADVFTACRKAGAKFTYSKFAANERKCTQ